MDEPVRQMSFKCLGCDRYIGWDGTGAFSYTCRCGATIFYNDETGAMAFPLSMLRNMSEGTPLPHLNDLVGEANHISPLTLKESVIKELRSKGFIWMEECEQCRKDGTLARKQERERYLAVREAEKIVRYPPEEC